MESHIWFTTHSSVNCGYDTCWGSPHCPLAVPQVVQWAGSVAFAPGAAAHSHGWPYAGFDCSASRSQQPAQANGVQLFQRSRTHGDKTSLLTGGPGRQAVVTPAGKGNTLSVAFLSWQILKTWPDSLAASASLYLHAILCCKCIRQEYKILIDTVVFYYLFLLIFFFAIQKMQNFKICTRDVKPIMALSINP